MELRRQFPTSVQSLQQSEGQSGHGLSHVQVEHEQTAEGAEQEQAHLIRALLGSGAELRLKLGFTIPQEWPCPGPSPR